MSLTVLEPIPLNPWIAAVYKAKSVCAELYSNARGFGRRRMAARMSRGLHVRLRRAKGFGRGKTFNADEATVRLDNDSFCGERKLCIELNKVRRHQADSVMMSCCMGVGGGEGRKG